jgi:hypothetical protein
VLRAKRSLALIINSAGSIGLLAHWRGLYPSEICSGLSVEALCICGFLTACFMLLADKLLTGHISLLTQPTLAGSKISVYISH